MAQYVIPAVATVVVAVIEALAAFDRKRYAKSRANEEVKEKRRTEEARLSMKMMNACVASFKYIYEFTQKKFYSSRRRNES